MNNKKLSKVTKIATASFLIAGTTAFTAFAAMPQGTVVIGEKAFDINYANIPEHVDEISKAVVESKGKVFVKGFDGKWVNNATGANVEDLSVIPAVEYKGKDGKVVKYQAKDGDVVTAGELTVSAVNSKTLEAKFNQPVDTAKAKIEVKKGSITSNVSKITWSEDKTTAKIELASKLFEGEYTVNVSGLSEKPMSAKVKVQNEKVAQIEILSENAVLNAGTVKSAVSVGYKVLNQYGEDITSKTTLNASSSMGTPSPQTTKGIIDITGLTNPKAGDKISLTLVHGETATVATKLLTVSEASKIDNVNITGLYNADKKVLSEDTKANDFYLLVDAKDQYGNAKESKDLNVKDAVLVNSTNPTVIKVDKFSEVTIDGKKVTALKLDTETATAGKAVISIVSLSTGKLTQYEVEVKDGLSVETIALSQPELAVAGEKVTIPFEAYDKEGNKVTDKKALDNVNFSGVDAKFEKDAAGKINLVADLKNKEKGKVTIIATPKSNKVVTMIIDVKAVAKPAYIASIKDIPTNVEAGGKLTIEPKNIVVKDQYERDYKLKDHLNDYNVIAKVNTKDSAILENVTPTISSTSDKIVLKGLTKGSENVTLSMQDLKSTETDKTISGSELEFTVRVAEPSEYTSYEVKDIDTIYDDSNVSKEGYKVVGTYTREVKVYGVLASGQKVELPDTAYTVVSKTAGVKADGNKLDVTSKVEYAKDAKEAKGTAVVTINAKGEQITKEFTISKVDPKVNSVEFDKNKVTSGATKVHQIKGAISKEEIFSVLDGATIKDQYGEKVIDKKFKTLDEVTVTGLISECEESGNKNIKIEGNGTSTISITSGADNGESFKLTFDVGGHKASVKANVEAQ